MGSTVLVLAIVAVWVVVLVPMFLRGHEKRNEMHSAERFAGAMRVLSRRRRPGRYDVRSTSERAETIGHALAPAASAPRPRSASVRGVPMTSSRLAARAAARRRGTIAMLAVFVFFGLLALVVGGAMWAVFGLFSILALAGLAQLRAMAIEDRYRAYGVQRHAHVDLTEPEPVRIPEAAPVRQTGHMPARQSVERPVAVGESSYGTPVVRGAGKQIVFDAVSETPVVEKPRVRTVAAPQRRVQAGMPADFYERPVSPPAPERRRPLLDEVDTDPDTLTSGLEALDSILGRAANE